MSTTFGRAFSTILLVSAGCATSSYQPTTDTLATFYTGDGGSVILVDGKAIPLYDFDRLQRSFDESARAVAFLHEARQVHDTLAFPRALSLTLAGTSVGTALASGFSDDRRRVGFALTSALAMLGALVVEAWQLEDRRLVERRRVDAVNVFNAERIERMLPSGVSENCPGEFHCAPHAVARPGSN